MPVVASTGPDNRHFDNIVMAMAEWVVALAEDLAVALG